MTRLSVSDLVKDVPERSGTLLRERRLPRVLNNNQDTLWWNERVSNRVFLLTPADTEIVSGEVASRPVDGFFNQS